MSSLVFIVFSLGKASYVYAFVRIDYWLGSSLWTRVDICYANAGQWQETGFSRGQQHMKTFHTLDKVLRWMDGSEAGIIPGSKDGYITVCSHMFETEGQWIHQ
ncbi:hypothetical protein EDD18DRAFT_788864 [Armillaria luteobubalina]|uniref:Uncharacterized protein n=1 Tax=Armillaria luteobubalina TaxID=153913 RepID=A0AA39USE8_9AGAR|nr:hypothetical protein EDD18DRAFT_788864 [Armillaria luteobubalina]